MRIAWGITDHVCAVCLGRVLVGRFRLSANGKPDFAAPRADGALVARCADCGRWEVGGEAVICCCGATLRGEDAGLECRINAERSATFPAEVVVAYAGLKIRKS